ncbi:MAG: LolA family protein [Sciscionella sp.]
MQSKRTTIGLATTGVVAGVVGIALIAAPASAGPAPSLPSVTPTALVSSVLTAKTPAFSGTISADNELGLPALPSMPQLANGTSRYQLYSDGHGRARLSIPRRDSALTLVEDGNAVYSYNSGTRAATKTELPRHGKAHRALGKQTSADPGKLADELIGVLKQHSVVSVRGTGTVAGRSAYELVLQPKPSEKTLLRQVRIAVDAKTRMPLQVEVFGNGSSGPALQVGFSSLSTAAPDAALFHFTPPAGVKVTDTSKQQSARANHMSTLATHEPKVVGSGWDTVIVASLPAGQSAPAPGDAHHGQGTAAMIQRLGTPVSGSWGSGRLVSIKLGSAIITSDGRVAAGAVPAQVLEAALAAK